MGKFDFKPLATFLNYLFKPLRYKPNHVFGYMPKKELLALNVLYF